MQLPSRSEVSAATESLWLSSATLLHVSFTLTAPRAVSRQTDMGNI